MPLSPIFQKTILRTACTHDGWSVVSRTAAILRNTRGNTLVGRSAHANQQQCRAMSSSKKKKKKGGSSHRYMERQLRDPFVKRAQAEQFRARSSFKLIELIDKHQLVPTNNNDTGMCVVDCGAAPGGWSQVVAQKMAVADTSGALQLPRIVAIDLLPMPPVPGVHFIQGDFLDPATKRQVVAALDNRRVGLVLSDMAPPFTGHHSVDADRTMNLCDDVGAFADEFLAKGGSMVLKFFMGGHESEMRGRLRQAFRKVVVEKPEASRKQSSEQYLVCIDKLT
ncbi:2' O-ribose methyltransferase [Coemansia sp. Benny D160-2]|nr:2' O-ribose methyltransferase [Coemansia sp. Benny D160-2]